ncbi:MULTISPECIES: type 2 isopentenyl-diphosphate Delta-isomerase [unclassified Paenibacillus]|uniref:type 2 isopentenyl-diphosphate Delta-isomerase n=1 Tax=unclassified Paenibacillus TaxID=185978 RepID=UPI001C0FBBEB|nr:MULTISPECIES: type 2 isopentenyl-diphosphate Delta-isomerase [unclassified Paenibacillus]MBU5443947.1 type 2 isopentenyl-diphosphate Delta-isomerase [Paenibacillus sp. MSJ-34]CAH0118727.1 Isopentenyl-diphosphate delta-isomerase [Paenibacillus sp. CECT 9249]
MRVSRKMEHVRHALQLGQSGNNGLSDIRFVHNALPEQSLSSVTLSTSIGELVLSSPIIINAMTGGAEETEAINRGFAEAAKETGIAMAVGSQMAALKHPEVRSSYTVVRKTNPDGIVLANLGGEATPEQALAAVEMLEANALQIHLNPMQELIMPEGDRDFRGMAERIGRIAETVPVPVIVKEVGFGLTRDVARRLREAGVKLIDVGGAGGTNFAAIENMRRTAPLDWLNDWGLTTSCALLEVQSVYRPEQIIASGGIAEPMDACKALAVGAAAVGVAGAFLRTLRQEGVGALIGRIREMNDHLSLLMTALGAPDVAGLARVPLVIGGATAEWCAARNIDIRGYGCRTD